MEQATQALNELKAEIAADKKTLGEFFEQWNGAVENSTKQAFLQTMIENLSASIAEKEKETTALRRIVFNSPNAAASASTSTSSSVIAEPLVAPAVAAAVMETDEQKVANALAALEAKAMAERKDRIRGKIARDRQQQTPQGSAGGENQSKGDGGGGSSSGSSSSATHSGI